MVEAMISLAVISIGLLAITRTQVASINGNRTALNSMKAALEINATMEQLLSMPFYTAGELTSLGSPITSGLPALPDGFTKTYTVTDLNVGDDTIKDLTIIVSWAEGSVSNPHNTRGMQSHFLMLPDKRRP